VADEARGRGVSVTIKYGKGYEESWANFTGLLPEVREDICTYFGVDGESVTELTLSELVVNVTALAHGKATASSVLGAVAIPESSSPAPAATVAQSSGDQTEGHDPWTQAGTEPEGPNPLLAQIEACTDVEALKRVWAENQAAFADTELMAVWKAKGKALQEAA